jgi:ABC-type nitrate/sulfonate/bicarbonate transport system substrate-binding protein
MIETKPDLVRRFVGASLESVAYLKAHPDYARDLYIKRTKASAAVADKALASVMEAVSPRGRGSGDDLVAAAVGNWRFVTESGAVSQDTGDKNGDCR